jgi:hypothetical protein
MDNKLAMALIIMLVLDVIFFLTNTAMVDINPAGSTLYDYDSSFISDYDIGNYTLQDVEGGRSILPEGTASVSTETGNVFTDTFKTSSNWIQTAGKGLNYLTEFLGGPTTILRDINAPREVTFSIGALWYILTLFFIIAFILGR